MNTPVFTPVSVNTSLSGVVSVWLVTYTLTVSSTLPLTFRSASLTWTYKLSVEV
jgi:hypothetical protein